jgi:aspartyl-tRNA(Asn)/glutamyl-tRNA(Gln) amidotransferase subunit A
MANNNDLTLLTAHEQAELLSSKQISSTELTSAYLNRIHAYDEQVNAYLTVTDDVALETAKEVDDSRAKGEKLHPLAGVPVAIKDIVVTKGIQTTAASRILEGWIPPYDAHIVTNIKAAKLPILGKTNMDEFAIGSSTEYSGYKVTHNPWNLAKVPGGSGGGSAAAIAASLAPLAVGSDTGGSIRQPAALTGTVGVKPTYGGVSRYGAIEMASSLDQLGPCAKTVLDTAYLQGVLGGYDAKDSTSLDYDHSCMVGAALKGEKQDLHGVKLGIVRELTGEGFAQDVQESFDSAVELLKEMGAEVQTVSCPSFDYSLAAYYILMPSEVSSNLARFDGMRYGLRAEGENLSTEQTMRLTRAKGFGKEVKRRIILGTHALSSGYYDAYYGSAQKVRTLIQRDFAAAFEKVDVLISPTAPTTAFNIGEKMTADPVTMYKNDIATIPVNLAGTPAMSLPSGLGADGMPIGFQIMAPGKMDDRLYFVGSALEKVLSDKYGAVYEKIQFGKAEMEAKASEEVK